MRILTALLAALVAVAPAAQAQGFVEVIPEDEIGVIFNQPSVLLLANGEELRGRVRGATSVVGYLSSFYFTPDSGGKRTKYTAEEVDRLTIRASRSAQFVMMNESMTSIREAAGADFTTALNREFIIFETARRANTRGTPRLMQLLNPGFDSVLKVYADPNAKKTLGLSMGGVRFAGGEDKSFLFVQGGSKAVIVKKSSYKENFEELYAACPVMLEAFSGAKLKWADVAGHVFVYDQICRGATGASSTAVPRPPE